MDIQRVSAGRGAAWINQSFGLLKNGGKAVWLPALVVGVLASMPLVGAAFGILIVFFYGGLVLCFDRPNAGFDAFSGFRDGGFGRLAPVLLLNLALAALALAALWPVLQPILQAAGEGREATPEEALAFLSGLAGPLLWLIPLSILVHWISQFAVPLATLKRLSGGEALSQALKAVFANLPALLVNLLCLTIADEHKLRGMLFWLMGDLGQSGQWWPALLTLAVALLCAMPFARELNLLARGLLQAQALGVSVSRLRYAIYLLASLATAASVTTAGSIGFIGLIVPHLVRLATGNDQRVLLPATVLAGGSLLVLADTLARTLIAPQQLPVGVLTALIGVPVFLFLLSRQPR